MDKLTDLLKISLVSILLLGTLSVDAVSKKNLIKKDPRDYTDADLEKLFEQWEEDEEPLEEDELPEHKRKPPPIDMSKLNTDNPEELLKLSKKGRTIMMFVTVSGNPTREEADKITGLWQVSLHNNHMDIQRYMVSDERAIFLFKDGSLAWEAKEFLVTQDRCKEVEIESKQYPGKGAEKKDNKKEL